MRRPLFAVVTLLPAAVFAGAQCEAHPKSEWMAENEAKATLVARGYLIRGFRVDGQCYQVFGRNKEGKAVEVYFDPKTLVSVAADAPGQGPKAPAAGGLVK